MIYNEEHKRMAKPVVFGWAVYVCAEPDNTGNVYATRYGMVSNEAEAQRWCAGVEPSELPTLLTEHPREFMQHIGTINL